VYRPSIEDVKGDRDWSELEQDLLDACKRGRFAYLPGKTDCPKNTEDPDRRVRVGLIRYLMLGGCGNEEGARPHPTGVMLQGGWIDGSIDLDSCVSQLDLSLQHCLLPDRASLQDARIGALFLTGSHAPNDLDLHRLITRGDVHLDDGFRSGATVDLVGAEIGGQLFCADGLFEAESESALRCDGARIDGSVFLTNGFRAKAEVSFARAEIGGQFAFVGGMFEAETGWALFCDGVRVGADVFLRDGFRAKAGVNFARAEIAGGLQIWDAELEAGINLTVARIGLALFWLKVGGERRRVNLTEAHVGSLRDDRESWERVGTLILDGFRYERLEADQPVEARLAWLAQNRRRPIELVPGAPAQTNLLDFDPQPHVQLASVLRAQGDREGAARVLVDREVRQRRAARRRVYAALNGSARAAVASILEDIKLGFDFFFRFMFGYGHRPMRALVWVAGFILVAAVFYGQAYDAGQFAPNSDVILTSDAWLTAVAMHDAGIGPMPLTAWLETEAAQDYETFNRWLYGLDLFVPLDALGQEQAWRPTTGRGALGEVAFYTRSVFQAACWIITAIGAAVLTGLVGRRD
jgi:hypothetical protein